MKTHTMKTRTVARMRSVAVPNVSAGLMRTNRSQIRRIRSGIQTGLKLGRSNDPAEQEADQVADQVMRMPQTSGTRGSRSSRQGNTAHGGEPLPTDLRGFFEPRFGQDFGAVRIHRGGTAESSARALQARAFTVGRDITFAAGTYRPHSHSGRRLIAHELTHVVQQSVSGKTAVQRQDHEGSEGLRLRWPPGRRREPMFRLELDPSLGLELSAMRYVQNLLNPESIRSSLFELDFATWLATQPPPWLSPEPRLTRPPLVPRGAGPSTPREAGAGDVLRAVMAIPTVSSALTSLRTQAADTVRRDWARLSGGERALVISQTALIGGGVLAGILTNPEARGFALDQIQGRDLPVPGVSGLSVNFQLTGPEQHVTFNLNVGALLPESMGFR